MPELNIIGAKEENRYFPYQQAFRVTRNSFWQAGQDSFTKPPSQNPDMFQGLTNIEPVIQGNLQRRRGYTLFSNTAPTTAFNKSFSYRNETLGTRRLVWTSQQSVVATDENGSILFNPLFTPSLTAGAVRMALSRSYGYFADGTSADNVKWGGTSNLSNWGITMSSASNITNTGSTTPTTLTQNNYGDSFLQVWSNLANLTATGSSNFATVTNGSGSDPWYSQYVFAGNFGFAIPSTDVIFGIVITLQVKASSNPIGGGLRVGLATNGQGNGTLPFTAQGVTPTITLQSIVLGSPTTTLGAFLTPSQINGAGFGITFFYNSQSNETISVNDVRITIYHGSGSFITVGAPAGAGSITLLSGRTYFCVFQNSVTGTTSNLNPASPSTGAVSGKATIPLSTIPISTDPQVDSRLILATADGNDQTTLYLIGTISDNTTTTFTDTLPDSTLLIQPVFQQTDQQGNLHGVANNNPPPLIQLPTKHKGRIFGVIAQTLYYSKNLDDVTTSTGTITTKWEEAWPATYTQDISEEAETVTALLSDGQTLYIATDHSIRQMSGDSPTNFSTPEVIFNETGVVSPEVWQVVFAEGQPVGTMWLTPDNRVMFSDFNTYHDLGTPIQDVLNTVNTAVVATVAHAAFVAKGPSEYYMLYIPTGSSTVPNTVCVFNLKSKKWVIWQPTDTPTTSLFNINANGIPQWLFATQAGPIYQWDSTVNVDRNGNTPVQYAASGRTSWLDFGDMGLTKAFNKMLITTGDPSLTVAVNGAIKDSDFLSGGAVVLPTSVLQQEIFGDFFVPMVGQPGFYKWYQVLFTSPASTVIDVLNAFDAEIAPSMRM